MGPRSWSGTEATAAQPSGQDSSHHRASCSGLSCLAWPQDPGAERSSSRHKPSVASEPGPQQPTCQDRCWAPCQALLALLSPWLQSQDLSCEKRGAEDEMVEWHHKLDGQEFEADSGSWLWIGTPAVHGLHPEDRDRRTPGGRMAAGNGWQELCSSITLLSWRLQGDQKEKSIHVPTFSWQQRSRKATHAISFVKFEIWPVREARLPPT